MKFVLYKYDIGIHPPSIHYLSAIMNGKPIFTKNAQAAHRYNIFTAVILAFRFNLSWIGEKYTPKG